MLAQPLPATLGAAAYSAALDGREGGRSEAANRLA